MRLHDVVFLLNEAEKIVVKLACSIHEADCCFRAPIVFVQTNKEYILGDGAVSSVSFNMHRFVDMLSLALSNSLQLHESLKKSNNIGDDIGYLYNEYLQNNISKLVYKKEKNEDYDHWVGDRHRLWGKELQVWIYNNQDGDIFLKFTPIFPGKFSLGDPIDSEEIENAAQYTGWIKDYTPFLTRKIPREVAQKWLEQANEIFQYMSQ